MDNGKKRGWTIAIALVAVAATVEGSEHKRLRADLQTTSRLVAAPEGRCVDEPGHAPVIGLLLVAGAGETTLIGTVVDEQSHCVRADGSFFAGRFTLTGGRGRTINGVYFGHLERTFNSTLPPPAPGGPWIIRGSVCAVMGPIEGACDPDDYEPAHGITNLSTGDATIFLDQKIRVD
jgi:hypothetical protein